MIIWIIVYVRGRPHLTAMGHLLNLTSQDSAGPVGKTILASQPAFTENLSNGHLATIHISDKFVQSIELNSAVRCSCIK